MRPPARVSAKDADRSPRIVSWTWMLLSVSSPVFSTVI